MGRQQRTAAGQTALHVPAEKPAMTTAIAALGTASSSEDTGPPEARYNRRVVTTMKLQASNHRRQWWQHKRQHSVRSAPCWVTEAWWTDQRSHRVHGYGGGADCHCYSPQEAALTW